MFVEHEISYSLASIENANVKVVDVTLKWELPTKIEHSDIFEDGKWIGRSFTNSFVAKSVRIAKLTKYFEVEVTCENGKRVKSEKLEIQ